MKPFILLLPLAGLAAAKPIIYMIRHGEKPADGGIGLSPRGKQRAQCLRSVFGPGSPYNIGKVMAQDYKKNGKRKRPYDTVLPVAGDLGLEVDHLCDRDDDECVVKAVENYDGDGNILLCWQHGRMNDIAEALGADHVEDYPDDRYDIIWTLLSPYADVSNVHSEQCPGLD